MIDKILEGLYKVFFILALIVSIYYFGISFSLLVSITFIFLLFAQKALQRILSSGICILAPFILNSAKTSVLSKYEFTTVISVVNGIFDKYSINYCLTKDMIDTVLVYTLLFVAVSVFFREDKTTIGKIASGGNPEFKDKTFIERQDSFCKTLSDSLFSINRRLEWNYDLYVPIETEVELTKGNKIKRYEDLLKCLKKNKSKVPPAIRACIKKLRNSHIGKMRIINWLTNFLESKTRNNAVYLVLGEPGSGKSVSLRKLCSELLSEARVTGKVPVYINLQTWMPEAGGWSKNKLPTQMDLIKYIKSELYKDGDIQTHGFLDDYFDLMLEDGRFYFIFDSFDEMPCLMGGEENGELITGFSELFHRFLTSSNQNGGIIASRLYNRPSNDYLDQTYTLRLQKFDNIRVQKMLKRYLPARADDIILKLFKDRIDLVELCRNPFHLSLLIDYLRIEHDFPDNQFELFKHFVEGRLYNESRVKEEGFTPKEIYDAAIELSVMMQKDRNYGLDFPMDRIYLSGKLFDKERWKKCISVLTYAKICRTGGNSQTVSFVHRRFQEFFFVEAIIGGKEYITNKNLIGILDNTGVRDALVLYCQIAEEEKIRSIISFCFDTITAYKDEISSVLNDKNVKIINALYFLIESFSNRKYLLSNDIDKIKGLREYLKKETHYAMLVAIVNSISLLEPEDVQNVMLDVFRINNRWLKTLMVSKCQFIQKLDRKTETGFCQLFESTNTDDLVHNFKNVNFSLSLSDCFTYLKRIHMLLMGVIFSMAVHKWSFMAYFSFFIVLFVMENGAYFIDVIYKLFGGTLNYLDIYYLENSRSISALSSQSITGERIFMLINLIILSLLMIAINASEVRLIANQRNSNHKNETANTDNRMSFKSIGRSIKKYFSSIKESNNLETESIKKNANQYAFMVTTPLIIMFCPTRHFLILFAVLEVYVTIYYLYRCIHEIKIPRISVSDVIYAIKMVIDLIKKLPERIAEKISEIIASLIATMILLIIISASIGVFFYIVPAVICSLTGNELTSHNGAIIALIMIILSAAFYILFHVIMKVKEQRKLKRLSENCTQSIDRKDLLQNIKKLTRVSSRRQYIKSLMDKGIILQGDWPDNYMSDIQDDVLIRSLAIWDSKEMRIKNAYMEMI